MICENIQQRFQLSSIINNQDVIIMFLSGLYRSFIFLLFIKIVFGPLIKIRVFFSGNSQIRVLSALKFHNFNIVFSSLLRIISTFD